MLNAVSMSSQGHYSLLLMTHCLNASQGKCSRLKYLNYTIIFHKCIQTAQMASQSSLWLLPRLWLLIALTPCDAIWLTPLLSFHNSVRPSLSPCFCETSKKNLRIAQHPLLCMHTSGKPPDKPAATTDGGRRGLSLRERHITSPPHLTQSVLM